MKNVLKLIFCPIWFLFDHNPNEKLSQACSKKGFLRVTITVILSLIVLFVFYLKEIIG